MSKYVLKPYTLVGVNSHAFSIMKYVENALNSSSVKKDTIEQYKRMCLTYPYEEVISLSQEMLDECNTFFCFNNLWERLGDIPVKDSGDIEEIFLHFERGTDREEIWHWFEETFKVTLGEILS